MLFRESQTHFKTMKNMDALNKNIHHEKEIHGE
jgi:hypothetical protein